jgi:hypothetical protein
MVCIVKVYQFGRDFVEIKNRLDFSTTAGVQDSIELHWIFGFIFPEIHFSGRS